MKKCPNCNQTYTDETLNFCLTDGSTLTNIGEEAPPTIFMNQARTTNQSNWAKNDPFTPPNFGQVSPWQNQSPVGQNPSYLSSNPYQSPNQTLAVVSLILGIAGFALFFCCYAGVPFGVAALATGFIGYNNVNKNPELYGGQGLAIAGMIMGALNIIGFVLIILISFLTNLR